MTSMPTPMRPRLAPLRGPAIAASALIGATCVVGIGHVWADWFRHGAVQDYVSGRPGVRVADLYSAHSTSGTVGALYLVTMLAAAFSLLVWLARARYNARLTGRPHRVRPGWVPGCWFASTALALALALVPREEAGVATLRLLARLTTGSLVLQCVLGALVVLLVRQVTDQPVGPPRRQGRA